MQAPSIISAEQLYMKVPVKAEQREKLNRAASGKLKTHTRKTAVRI